MRRLAPSLWLCLVLPACGDAGAVGGEPPDAAADAGFPSADGELQDDAGADRASLVVAAGVACDEPGRYTCLGDHVLFCRDGYGGARWMDRGPCDDGARCADGYGCAPLPACGGEGLVACVGADAFTCDDDGAWSWQEMCPEEVPCVHGRGCPNVDGIGTECAPSGGPRCPGGEIQRCVERGMESVWARPEACPEGSECREGAGCVRPGACDDPDRAKCDDGSAIYCHEGADGTLEWSDPVHCRDGCIEGGGCRVHCRAARWVNGCF